MSLESRETAYLSYQQGFFRLQLSDKCHVDLENDLAVTINFSAENRFRKYFWCAITDVFDLNEATDLTHLSNFYSDYHLISHSAALYSCFLINLDYLHFALRHWCVDNGINNLVIEFSACECLKASTVISLAKLFTCPDFIFSELKSRLSSDGINVDQVDNIHHRCLRDETIKPLVGWRRVVWRYLGITGVAGAHILDICKLFVWVRLRRTNLTRSYPVHFRQWLLSEIALIPSDEAQPLNAEVLLMIRNIFNSARGLTGPLGVGSSNRKNIIVGNRYLFDSEVAQYVAYTLKTNGAVYGMQHGGYYGSYRRHLVPRYTEFCLPAFVTYGWKESIEKVISRFIPLGSPLYKLNRAKLMFVAFAFNIGLGGDWQRRPLFVEGTYSVCHSFINDCPDVHKFIGKKEVIEIIERVNSSFDPFIKRKPIFIGAIGGWGAPRMFSTTEHRLGFVRHQVLSVKYFPGVVLLDEVATPFFERIGGNRPIALIYSEAEFRYCQLFDSDVRKLINAMEDFGFVLKGSAAVRSFIQDYHSSSLLKAWYHPRLQARVEIIRKKFGQQLRF